MSEPETKYEVAVKAMLEERKSDTPETDEAKVTFATVAVNLPDSNFELVTAIFARKLERERNIYKTWANLFRDLLAPLAWLDGTGMTKDTEKAIIQYDEQKPE